MKKETEIKEIEISGAADNAEGIYRALIYGYGKFEELLQLMMEMP